MAKLFSPLKFLKIDIKVPKSKALPAYTASIHPVDSDQPQSVLQRYVFLFIIIVVLTAYWRNFDV